VRKKGGGFENYRFVAKKKISTSGMRGSALARVARIALVGAGRVAGIFPLPLFRRATLAVEDLNISVMRRAREGCFDFTGPVFFLSSGAVLLGFLSGKIDRSVKKVDDESEIR